MIVALAVAFDGLFGEPPNAIHPVAWFGKFVDAFERRAPHGHPGRELFFGALISVSGIGIAILPALALERVFQKRTALGIFASALLLKLTFAWRALVESGERVRRDLEAQQWERSRTNLRALVSRDTMQLDSPLLAAAAIESLAENASDAFIAPLFYYHLFGLKGALAYRAANTLDSMLGYHGRYEFLGKIPARLDDALNLIPSRLTAFLIVAAAKIARVNPRGAFRIWRSDHALTASPNAGNPMSAMAGGLDVRLEKVGHYRLNESGHAPTPRDIARAARIVNLALLMATMLSVFLALRRKR